MFEWLWMVWECPGIWGWSMPMLGNVDLHFTYKMPCQNKSLQNAMPLISFDQILVPIQLWARTTYVASIGNPPAITSTWSWSELDSIAKEWVPFASTRGHRFQKIARHELSSLIFLINFFWLTKKFLHLICICHFVNLRIIKATTVDNWGIFLRVHQHRFYLNRAQKLPCWIFLFVILCEAAFQEFIRIVRRNFFKAEGIFWIMLAKLPIFGFDIFLGQVRCKGNQLQSSLKCTLTACPKPESAEPSSHSPQSSPTKCQVPQHSLQKAWPLMPRWLTSETLINIHKLHLIPTKKI